MRSSVKDPTTPQGSRQGKRAPGITVLTIPMHRELRARLRKIAAARHMTSAAFVRDALRSLATRIEAGERGAIKRGATS